MRIKSKLIPLMIGLAGISMACSSRTPPTPIYDKVVPGNVNQSAQSIPSHTLDYRKSKHTMSYSFERPSKTDRNNIKVSIRFNQADNENADQIWLDQNTLSFRRRFLPMPGYEIDVSMNKGLFSGKLTPATNSDYTAVNYNKQYPHGAFEPAIINYAIATLPLKMGYTASIPVLDLNDGSHMFWSNIKVLDEETIKIDGKRFDTWKVESDGIRKKVIWIDKQQLFAVKMKTSGNLGQWKVVPASIKIN